MAGSVTSSTSSSSVHSLYLTEDGQPVSKTLKVYASNPSPTKADTDKYNRPSPVAPKTQTPDPTPPLFTKV
jgi:hypothetical protein